MKDSYGQNSILSEILYIGLATRIAYMIMIILRTVTMAEDTSEIVSQFFLDTCQQRHRVNHEEIKALLAKIDLKRMHDDDKSHVIPLTTGSAAELYIDPMLPCIGDTDIMFHCGVLLAIPEGSTPPTQLPNDFGKPSSVAVYEIIDSEFPGYVYLLLCCSLNKCSENDSYHVEECERVYASYKDVKINRDSTRVHGPAIIYERAWYTSRVEGEVKKNISVDRVFCLRCLLWPSQAADWPTRRRNNGWPDSATVDRVVSNGCDVVVIAHPLCRQDEWMGSIYSA